MIRLPPWGRAAIAAALIARGARGQERSAAEIVAAYEAIRIPWSSGMSAEEYDAMVRERCGRQCALALELRTRFPDHPRVAPLMRGRWALLINVFDDPARVLEEAASVPEPLRKAAAFARAHATLETADAPVADKLDRVREAVRRDPDDQESVAFLLYELAKNHIAAPGRQREILRKVVAECAGTSGAERSARHLKALDNVGKELRIDLVAPILAGPAGAPPRFRIVHIWSTWSQRDRKDLADLARIRSDGVAIASVVAGDDAETLERARRLARDAGLDGAAGWALHAMPRAAQPDDWWTKLDLDGWPAFLLLDARGRIVAVTGRAPPLAEAVRDA